MDNYSYASNYLTRNGEPWFPVMGELHYSRCPEEYWGESLDKMRAGGVEVVSTYVIWIHHEEIEGEYDFTGLRDLRRFIGLCGARGLKLFLRIGPWCHGEVRNGGFPDWLLRKSFECRTNSPEYLEQVKRFYTTIFEQARGYLHKDGGPVIGVQIENEYGHAGGLSGEEGEKHMRTLAKLAHGAGFDVPYYTATGWGGAVTGGLLPVMGGYCDAPWDHSVEKLGPSGNYIFTHERNDANIGNDRRLGEGLTFDPAQFPFLTAELGGGLQVTSHRRPVATARDIGAMSLVKLGSGVNLLGYYMYHGGTNPVGKLTTLQESRETGYPNDLPVLSYDFNAPIREYGQMSETLRELKLLAMFLRDFGSGLCMMPAFIPEENPLSPDNLTGLRTSVRHGADGGYIFVNNYQRGYRMSEHRGAVLRVELGGDELRYPAVDIENGEYFFFPFNMNIRGALLKTATATPLCVLNSGEPGETFVFYADRDPNYEFEGNPAPGAVLTLTRREALDAWRVRLDREYLVISENPVLESADGLRLVGRAPLGFKIFPRPEGIFEGYERMPDEGELAVFAKRTLFPRASVSIAETTGGSDDPLRRRFIIELSGMDYAEDWFLRLRYEGDRAEAFLDGKLVADSFYTGQEWEIGLKRLGFPRRLEIAVKELRRDAKVYLEKWPETPGGRACGLVSAELEPEVADKLVFIVS